MAILSRACLLALLLLGGGCQDAKAPPDDLGRACAQIAQCAGESGETQPECERRLSSEYDDAASYGCAGPYASWVTCLASGADICPPEVVIDDEPAASKRAAPPAPQSCDGQQLELQRCQGEHRPDE